VARLELFLTPRRNIIPATEHDVDVLRGVPAGTVFTAKTGKPRNLAHHRKYRALLAFIAAHHPTLRDPEAVAFVLKVRAGFCSTHITNDGEIVHVPRSTAFDECDQVDFDGFYRKCLDELFDYFYPEIAHDDRPDFLAEALRFSQ
jgi:hypothetical protein